jgi:putative transposase
MNKNLIDKLLAEYKSTEELLGKDGLLEQLTKAILQRVLRAETTQWDADDHDPPGRTSDHKRNGKTKRRNEEFGNVDVEAQRYRQSSRNSKAAIKEESRFAFFDNRILTLYALGLSTREIQVHLEAMYPADRSLAPISALTDALDEEVKAWQRRPLDALYPLVYLDARMVKIRTRGRVESRAVHMATGITLGGHKDVLGLWASPDDGAKFWVRVLTELQNRGVKDILIACTDELPGLRQAIQPVFPEASVQLCILHMVRASLNYVSWKERRAVARDLKLIYRAPDQEEAERQLVNFAQQWDERYPSVGTLWRRQWSGVVPFFRLPLEIRKIIYTTNALESLNVRLGRTINRRFVFPSEESVLNATYLALRNLNIKRTAVHGWKEALNRFSIIWEARFPQNNL